MYCLLYLDVQTATGGLEASSEEFTEMESASRLQDMQRAVDQGQKLLATELLELLNALNNS